MRWIILLLITHMAFADSAIESLLRQERQPTIREIKEALGEIQNNPLPCGGDLAQWKQAALTSIPPLIARFEGLAPNAKYYSLGRDALLLADILEAFYDSIGESNRVGRIPLSSNSFNNSYQQQQNLVRVLQGAGMDLNELGVRPQIIFDRTSLGTSSQSTRVLKAAFGQAFQQGLSADVLAGNLFVASTVSGVLYEPPEREAFIEQHRQLIKQHQYASTALQIPEAQIWTDGPEWHEVFGALRTRSDGFLEGTPGQPTDAATRNLILAKSIQLILVMKDPEILEAVKARARSMGFEFDPGKGYVPPPQISPEERERLRLESLKERLNELVEKLPPKSEQTGYLSINGMSLKNWLEEVGGVKTKNPLYLLFIRKTLEAHASGKIGDRDLRRLIARCMGKMQIPDDILRARFAELYAESPALQELFQEKRGVYLESKQKDANEVANTFRYLEQAFGCAETLSKAVGMASLS